MLLSNVTLHFRALLGLHNFILCTRFFFKSTYQLTNKMSFLITYKTAQSTVTVTGMFVQSITTLSVQLSRGCLFTADIFGELSNEVFTTYSGPINIVKIQKCVTTVYSSSLSVAHTERWVLVWKLERRTTSGQGRDRTHIGGFTDRGVRKSGVPSWLQHFISFVPL